MCAAAFRHPDRLYATVGTRGCLPLRGAPHPHAPRDRADVLGPNRLRRARRGTTLPKRHSQAITPSTGIVKGTQSEVQSTSCPTRPPLRRKGIDCRSKDGGPPGLQRHKTPGDGAGTSSVATELQRIGRPGPLTRRGRARDHRARALAGGQVVALRRRAKPKLEAARVGSRHPLPSRARCTEEDPMECRRRAGMPPLIPACFAALQDSPPAAFPASRRSVALELPQPSLDA